MNNSKLQIKARQHAQKVLAEQGQETIADFKQRIALMMRNREGGKVYSIIGASRPPEWCRKKTVDSPKQDGIIQ